MFALRSRNREIYQLRECRLQSPVHLLRGLRREILAIMLGGLHPCRASAGRERQAGHRAQIRANQAPPPGLSGPAERTLEKSSVRGQSGADRTYDLVTNLPFILAWDAAGAAFSVDAWLNLGHDFAR